MAWRYLAENKTSEGPRHIFSVDTETVREPADDPKHSVERLRLGVVRYCRLEHGKPKSRVALAFRTSQEFWDFVQKHSEPRSLNWVFAHGLGFDIRVLGWQGMIDTDRLLLRRWRDGRRNKSQGTPSPTPETGLLVLDGVPTIIESWLECGSRLRFCDTRNWWHCRLAEIGDSIGLQKLPMPEPWESEETWLTYCARDCEIVETAVVGLINWTREQDLGVFKCTAPSQAMQAFRHRFHSRRIVLHDMAEVKDIERESYHAGRIEMFFSGKIERSDRGVNGLLFDKFDETAPSPVGTVYKLDVNGLFPSVMRGNRFPVKLKHFTGCDGGYRWLGKYDYSRMIARVRLCNCPFAVPVINDGKLVYASGTLETTLAGPELSAADECGSIESIEWYSVYETDEIFTNYVDYFQQLRYMAKLAGNVLHSKLCKLMLNSLYGKFAQRSFEWETLPRQVPPDRWANWCSIDAEAKTIREYRVIGDLVQVRADRGDHPNSFVAISSFVTAFARRRMDQLRAIAGPHNVYYQAVDSLFVGALGLERLQDAGEVDDCALGKLRLEGESSCTEFLAKGVYCFDGKWTLTSVRGNATPIDSLHFEQDQFQSLAQSVANPPLDGVRVSRVEKKLATQPGSYDILPSGWIRPRVFDQWGSGRAEDDVRSNSSPQSISVGQAERSTFGMACENG